MAWLSFMESDRLWSMWSDWLVFCDYGFSVSDLWCPLATPTVLLGFLLHWTWGISSRLLQQSTATAPYLGRGVSPYNKGPSSQGYGFSSGHVWMWELNSEESWEPKNWCFWTVVLEKTLESPLDSKEVQLVHPKEDQSWVFIGRTDAKAETPILWPLHAKSWLTGKDLDAGRDWGQEEKGTTEDEMAGWHHRLDGHEFEWTLGVGDG